MEVVEEMEMAPGMMEMALGMMVVLMTMAHVFPNHCLTYFLTNFVLEMMEWDRETSNKGKLLLSFGNPGFSLMLVSKP